MDKAALEKLAARTKQAMEQAAKEMEFMEAARLRDEYFALNEMIASR
jgi:excinuclease ABC subunit B